MENSSAKPITDPKVMFLYHRTRGDSPNLDRFLANCILVGGAYRMMSDRFHISSPGVTLAVIDKDANPGQLEAYPFEVRAPSATVVISIAIAWRFGINFWSTASNAVLSLQDIPTQAIWEITRDDNNARTAWYLHPDHHYSGRLGQRIHPWNGQLRPAKK